MIKLVMIYKKVNQKINQMIKKYKIKKYVILILKNNESKKEICDINFKKLNLKIKKWFKKAKN